MPTGQAAAQAKKEKSKPLTQLQKRFVEELCVDWKKGPAARRAGYSADTAKQMGQKLWADPRIKAAVKARRGTGDERRRGHGAHEQLGPGQH